MPSKRIFLIDDDFQMLTIVQNILEDEGYEIKTATDGRIALSAVEKEDFNLVLIKMPITNGIELLNYIEQNRPDLKVVVITSSGQLLYPPDAHAFVSNKPKKPLPVLKAAAKIEAERNREYLNNFIKEIRTILA